MAPKAAGVVLLLAVWFVAPAASAPQAPSQPGGGRTPSARVGAVMALLATFEDAGVLPPEQSPDANRLIKALIQFQAAFVKSGQPAVQRWLRESFAARFGAAAPEAIEAFRTGGWTSRYLEAVVDYAAGTPVWDDPDTRNGFLAFNVGRSDFDLLAGVFVEARAKFSAGGRTIHEAFDARRGEMPGARSSPRDERPGSM